ncbi:hypothetical protein ACLKA7_010725 [Drosophila subpalustris]
MVRQTLQQREPHATQHRESEVESGPQTSTMRTIVPLYWPVPVDRLAITLANTMGWDGLAQKVGPAKKLDSFETALRLHWAAAAAVRSASFD